MGNVYYEYHKIAVITSLRSNFFSFTLSSNYQRTAILRLIGCKIVGRRVIITVVVHFQEVNIDLEMNYLETYDPHEAPLGSLSNIGSS